MSVIPEALHSNISTDAPSSFPIRKQVDADLPTILDIHERVFGPGRFTRAAFKIRENASEERDLCFVAAVPVTEEVIGSVILSNLMIGKMPGLLLGPLAVRPSFKNRGAGRALLAHAVEQARIAGFTFVLLIGDEPYYGPYGFNHVPTGSVNLPWPADPKRILINRLQDDDIELTGDVSGFILD